LSQVFRQSILGATPSYSNFLSGLVSLMKYRQIDKITSLEPGRRLVGERTLHKDEHYLLDHFPRFPVMPGVMMLEALHQAAVWLIRTGDQFQTPLVLLREVRSVKFGDFLEPGETLEIIAELVKADKNMRTVKGTATKDGRVTVSGKLVLELCRSNDAPHIGTDEDVLRRSKKQFRELFGDLAVATA
jgi:3-hydroxyacyl-[acyl-carrier-protein] dehydratase